MENIPPQPPDVIAMPYANIEDRRAYDRARYAQQRKARQEQDRRLCEAHAAAKQAGIRLWGPGFKEWIEEYLAASAT